VGQEIGRKAFVKSQKGHLEKPGKKDASSRKAAKKGKENQKPRNLDDTGKRFS